MSYRQSNKQDTLVSGTNIKTVNSQSLLGSGNISISGATLADGDYGDITVGGSGTTMTIDNLAITNAKINDVDWSKVTGEPTTLSGYGISDTKANFDSACSDGNFLYVGDVTQYTDENAQDAVGGMAANSTFVNLTYSDATPSLTPSLSATGTPSSSTFLRGDNTWAAPTDPEGWTVIVKSANQDVTNNATLQDDTELQFSVVAGGHYMIGCELTISGFSTTADYKFGFAVASGTMTGKGHSQSISAAGAIQNLIVTANGATTTSIAVGASTAGLDDLTAVSVAFSFTASANTTFKFQFANNTATAGAASRTWKGSILRYKRLD